MLLLCWNVAGFSTTVKRIHETYGRPKETKTKTSSGSNRNSNNSSVVLADYFGRHGADVVCLQEHKIPLSQLSTRSEPYGCAEVEGYESFWSCCVDERKKGLNGVVTYVKTSCVPVLSANSRPLGAPDLDDQGRCVLTDHGDFVIFNVYVPASSGQPLSYKMKFLNALRKAMNEQRTKFHKKVILVGDLNITHTPIDRFWSDRSLFVNDIRKEVLSRKNDISTVSRWKLDIAEHWPAIEKALATKKVVPTQTTNSLTNQKYNKYRLVVKVNEKDVFLGSNESDPGYCEYPYSFSSWNYLCSETEDYLCAEEENVVAISTMAELLRKIASVHWSESLQREIAATFGGMSRKSPPRQWLNRIIQEDGMVDAMRAFYPTAEGRFTCWHQFTNKRYSNEGARIDFTLVDASLMPEVLKGNVPSLRCACTGNNSSQPKPNQHTPESDEAALCAATCGGNFRPVSFEGGGIVEATLPTLDSQFGTPHTGMIYTPPSFSDHTAISLLLKDDFVDLAVDRVDDPNPSATRKAQPHKAQKSISSFFSSSNTSIPKEATKLTRTVFPSTSGSQKRGIASFFTAQTDTETKPSTNEASRATVGTKRARPVNLSKAKVSKKGSILNHFSKKK